MLDVYLCHSQTDRDAAVAMAARLGPLAEAKVWLGECDTAAGQTVAEKWDAGLSSAAILLLLSPEAVPRERTRTAWHSVLEHWERHESPPLGSILLRNCDYARLLEQRNFFRWKEGEASVVRALTRWLMTLHPASERREFVPARLPWFGGRAAELDLLHEALVDRPGTAVLAGDPGSGKTSLAQEFARTAAAHFRDILWIDCGGRSVSFLAGDMEAQLGIRPAVPLEHGLEHLIELALQHRILLILDDLDPHSQQLVFPTGLASVLITTRSQETPVTRNILRLEAIGACAPAPPGDPGCQALWRAMAACRRNSFPLDLAAAVAGLSAPLASEACERLVAAGCAEPLDSAGLRFRLSARSQEAALSGPGAEAFRRAHADALNIAFGGTNPHLSCQTMIAELENGLEWAFANDGDTALNLALRSSDFLKKNGRPREAAHVYALLRDRALARGNRDLAAECSWELSWLQDEPGEIRRRALDPQQLDLFSAG